MPTGNVTAAISGGVLTLTGDDLNNVVSIEITATKVIVTPDATTSVNGAAVNTPVDVLTVPTSLKAAFFDGNDSLSIKNNVDFILTGGASVDLGGGANALNFLTSTKIELGNLLVLAGDDNDTVVVSAGAALGKVTGKASFDYGDGFSTTTLAEVNFTGPQGLSIKGTGTFSTVSNVLNATNIQVPKGVSMTGKGGVQSIFTGSTIGKLTESGLTAATSLTTTTVNGDVKLKAVFQADLTADTVTIKGNVDLKAAGLYSVAGSDWTGTNSVTGNISQSSGFQTAMAVGGAAADTFTVSGDITLKGTVAILDTGTVAFAANDVSLSGSILSFDASGKSATINSNLTTKAIIYTETQFNTTSLSEVKGNISSTGGWFIDAFTTNSMFKADKNITLKFKDNANSVAIGDGTAPVAILGNLSVETGNGNDVVNLRNVAITGKTKLNTGGGSDSLFVNSASVFTGTFFADLGAGDDFVSIAQTAGAVVAVKFNGKATIKTGDGNDMLQLGVAAGDAGQVATFAAGSSIDGGSGFNSFDDDVANFTGLVLGTDIVNWTDV